jgi:hypothetical protein
MAKRSVAELSAAEKSEIAEWYAEGIKTREIEEAFDLASSVPTLVAREFGLPGRAVRGSSRSIADFETLTLPDPVEHEGELLIRDIDLGRVLGYREPRDFRQLIKRKIGVTEATTALCVTTLFTKGNGAQGKASQFLLTEEQAVLACIHCGLPNADAIKALVAKIFTKWRQGKLVSTDAETTIEIQDAVEQFIEASPEVASVVTPDIMAAISGLATKEDLQRVAYEIRRDLGAKRQGVTLAVKRQHIEVDDKYFGGNCPCCFEVKIVEDGKRLPSMHIDHHTGNRNKNGAHQTWPVCEACNQGFEHGNVPRENFRTEVDNYERRRKQYAERVQPTLL